MVLSLGWHLKFIFPGGSHGSTSALEDDDDIITIMSLVGLPLQVPATPFGRRGID